jgi:hypothetical protein
MHSTCPALQHVGAQIKMECHWRWGAQGFDMQLIHRNTNFHKIPTAPPPGGRDMLVYYLKQSIQREKLHVYFS